MTTVLVVDDRATNREIARATLDLGGYRVLEARAGAQALSMAKASHPDLVVTDVLMPGMDGYEFVHQLRGDPDTADIPVLFYTANYRVDEAQPLAALSGVSRIVSKSAEPAELLDAVGEALRQRPAPVDAAHDAFGVQHLHTVNAKLVEKVQALDESEARFRIMAESSPMGIVIANARALATYVNPRLSHMTHIPVTELLGPGWLRRLQLEEHEEMLRAGGGPCLDCAVDGLRHHSTVILPDGQQRRLTVLIRSTTDTEGVVTGFVAMVDDVTAEVTARERERAEEQQREAEARRQVTARLDSLARLAGGVAHDFNNLLNVIMSADELLKESVTETTGQLLKRQRAAAMLDDLDQIYRAGQRAAHLTHQLLTFGRREAVTPSVVDANALVRDVWSVTANDIGKRVTIRTDLDPKLRRVHVDANQLSQVLLNLAANAADAMPEGGELHLRTANVRIDTAGQVAGLPAGEYVHVSVTDTGHGMPPEVVEHAMEPFFTTKPNGSGAGLGLATAYGVVTQAGGQLIIDSTPGRGTTVHFYLPATDQLAAVSRPVGAAPETAEATVLLAEDEDSLRDVVTRLLTRAGYRVLAARDGKEALSIAESYGGAIDALLTDVAMPAMNGRELAEGLHRIRPATPVLYMSGYAASIMTAQGMLDPEVTLLSKPFTKIQLLEAMHATLRAQPAQPTRAAS